MSKLVIFVYHLGNKIKKVVLIVLTRYTKVLLKLTGIYIENKIYEMFLKYFIFKGYPEFVKMKLFGTVFPMQIKA